MASATLASAPRQARINQVPRRARVAAVVCAVAALAHAQPGDADRPRLGYTSASFVREHAVERQFQTSISSQSLSEQHRAITRRPHIAATDGGREVADYLRQTLTRAGLDVDVLEYQVFLSHPRRIQVELVDPTTRRLSVREPALDLDPDTRHPELTDAFVAYSPSADVTAQVVYVNYGLPADYAQLGSLGVDVKGKIALARYGRSHRAVKVYTAEKAGAVGVILYSDPADDGFARGPVWPPGYWRGEQLPQRGNAKYSWFWHGDPLTPGVAAVASAARLDASKVPTLPRIPVVALSSGEARHLLEALTGPVGPQNFQGALPFIYRVGPGAGRARLSIDMDNRLRTIRNVVARVRGSTTPDRMVLLGGHHDAWTFGGVDPGTGAAALLEVAKGLGQLAAGGWRPKRTIGIAFWDAEEYGLIGSTEFVEHKKRELREQLVVYVNTDMYMTGRFDAGGVPSLRDFLVDVAKDVPEREGTVYDHWRASSGEVKWKALGSGADFVPFQDHLGAPTLSVEFIGENGYGFGTYHSNLDTRAYAEKVADPGFAQGAVLARMLGTLALRMAGADVLPFRFSTYVQTMSQAVAEAETWARDWSNRPSGTPNLARVRGQLERLRDLTSGLERTIDEGLSSDRLPDARTPSLNDRLGRLEQQLCDDDGASSSRWYRHVVHGWNIYSLYDGQPFPGLAEALDQKDPARVAREVDRIERALERMIGEIGRAYSEVRQVR